MDTGCEMQDSGYGIRRDTLFFILHPPLCIPDQGIIPYLASCIRYLVPKPADRVAHERAVCSSSPIEAITFPTTSSGVNPSVATVASA